MTENKQCKVEGCDGKVKAKGYCSRHYMQMHKYGEIKTIAKRSTFENRVEVFFKSFIKDRNNGCWNWVKSKSDKGYGQFRIGKVRGAHRASWLIHKGEDPGDLLVCHKCDNPGCVRIDHLWLGSHQDNMADKMIKNRHIGPRGEKSSLSKLNRDQVSQIREMYLSGSFTCEGIGEKFEMSGSAIWHIISGNSWSHLIPDGERIDLRPIVREKRKELGIRIGRGKGLKRSDIDEIRATYKKGINTYGEFAEKHGVSNSCIGRIINGQTWA